MRHAATSPRASRARGTERVANFCGQRRADSVLATTAECLTREGLEGDVGTARASSTEAEPAVTSFWSERTQA
jgi:hypothetical protein